MEIKWDELILSGPGSSEHPQARGGGVNPPLSEPRIDTGYENETWLSNVICCEEFEYLIYFILIVVLSMISSIFFVFDQKRSKISPK